MSLTEPSESQSFLIRILDPALQRDGYPDSDQTLTVVSHVRIQPERIGSILDCTRQWLIVLPDFSSQKIRQRKILSP